MASTDTADTLHTQLRSLGIRPNQLLMVHASMRALAPTRAHTFIRALTRAVHPNGTLLMVLGADPDEPFDALHSPVDTEDLGVLAEVFRTYPNTHVNDHPAARFAALGPLASTLLNPTPLHDYYGPGSVLERFAQHSGWVARFGADIDTITLTHHAEYLADLPNARRVRRRYVRADSGELWIESLDDSDGIFDWSHGDYFAQLARDFLATSHTTTQRVGSSTAELFSAASFLPFAVSWMRDNLTPPNIL